MAQNVESLREDGKKYGIWIGWLACERCTSFSLINLYLSVVALQCCISSCYCLATVDTFAALHTVTHQAPLSMGFSRQQYWSGLPFPHPADLSDPGIESTSCALANGFFTTELPGKTVLASGCCSDTKLCLTQRVEVFASSVQQNESAIHKHASFLFWVSISLRIPECIKESSLCPAVCSHQLSILFLVSRVYVCGLIHIQYWMLYF